MTGTGLLIALALVQTVLQLTMVSSAPVLTNRTASDDCFVFPSSKWATCCDIQRNMSASGSNITSGVYSLDHFGPFSTTQGYCDLETEGGGWLVVFRRQNQYNFRQTLKTYEDGFGKLEEGNTFWYGLKALSHLTNRSIWEMRVDLANSDHKAHALYANFSIGDPSEGYKLKLGPFVEDKSTASDSLREYNGNMFYTWDSDGPDSNSCAHSAGGGWWYTTGECGGQRGGILTAAHAHLAGWYSESAEQKVIYNHIEIKLRQKDCLGK